MLGDNVEHFHCECAETAISIS